MPIYQPFKDVCIKMSENKCGTCNGKGTVFFRNENSEEYDEYQPCPDCHGTGVNNRYITVSREYGKQG